jgi:hypothetical protein
MENIFTTLPLIPPLKEGDRFLVLTPSAVSAAGFFTMKKERGTGNGEVFR